MFKNIGSILIVRINRLIGKLKSRVIEFMRAALSITTTTSKFAISPLDCNRISDLQLEPMKLAIEIEAALDIELSDEQALNIYVSLARNGLRNTLSLISSYTHQTFSGSSKKSLSDILKKYQPDAVKGLPQVAMYRRKAP